MLGFRLNLSFGVTMSAVVAEPTFRGVICQSCGKPIRLSAAVIKRQAAIQAAETKQNQDANPDLITKVFPARCRRCHKEGLYALAELADFPEE
jgi:hypothetical protein